MSDKTRRSFLIETGILTAGVMVPGTAIAADKKQKGGEAEVTPTEDLMREHGLMNRVLLIYEECLRRLRGRGELDTRVLFNAADIIKNFIENYHEKLEEDYLFPRFKKAGKLMDLVDVLQQQHEVGRRVTARIQQLATPATLRNAIERQQLVVTVASFIHMYRPHEAREDTVLFPALHQIVSAHEFDALGEDFEKKEHELFGKEGFEGMVEKVGEIEKLLEIYDLARFTPIETPEKPPPQTPQG